MVRDRGSENVPNNQLIAISDGLNQRINTGAIPTVDAFRSEFSKGLDAAEFTTPDGLRMKVFANEQRGRELVESVTVSIEDYGNDSELTELIKARHGNVPVSDIEIMLGGERAEENGRARLISPLGEGRLPVYTQTYTYISPDVTEAIVKRIPAAPPQVQSK